MGTDRHELSGTLEAAAIEGLSNLLLFLFFEKQVSDQFFIERMKGLLGAQRGISDAGLRFALGVLDGAQMQFDALLHGGVPSSATLSLVKGSDKPEDHPK